MCLKPELFPGVFDCCKQSPRSEKSSHESELSKCLIPAGHNCSLWWKQCVWICLKTFDKLLSHLISPQQRVIVLLRYGLIRTSPHHVQSVNEDWQYQVQVVNVTLEASLTGQSYHQPLSFSSRIFLFHLYSLISGRIGGCHIYFDSHYGNRCSVSLVRCLLPLADHLIHVKCGPQGVNHFDRSRKTKLQLAGEKKYLCSWKQSYKNLMCNRVY